MLTKTDLKAIEKLIEPVKKTQEIHSKELKKIISRVDSNSGSLMAIEQEIGAYKEGLQLQKEKLEKHENRLTKVEKTLAI